MRKLIITISINILMISCYCFSQNIDSLENVISALKEENIKLSSQLAKYTHKIQNSPKAQSISYDITYNNAKDMLMDGNAALGKIACFEVENEGFDSDDEGAYVSGIACTNDGDDASRAIIFIHFTSDQKSYVGSWSGCRKVKIKITSMIGFMHAKLLGIE